MGEDGIFGGNCHPRACTRKNSVNRFKQNENLDNVVIIDLEADIVDDVIIIDVPETLRKKLPVADAPRGVKVPYDDIISIDDDDDDDNDADHAGCSAHGVNDLNGDPAYPSTNSASSDANQCPPREGNSSFDFSKGQASCHSKVPGKRYGLSSDSGSSPSDSDCSDCELLEGSSRKLHEQWEKASLRRKRENFHDHSGWENQPSTSSFHAGASSQFGAERTCSTSADKVERGEFSLGNFKDHIQVQKQTQSNAAQDRSCRSSKANNAACMNEEAGAEDTDSWFSKERCDERYDYARSCPNSKQQINIKGSFSAVPQTMNIGSGGYASFSKVFVEPDILDGGFIQRDDDGMPSEEMLRHNSSNELFHKRATCINQETFAEPSQMSKQSSRSEIGPRVGVEDVTGETSSCVHYGEDNGESCSLDKTTGHLGKSSLTEVLFVKSSSVIQPNEQNGLLIAQTSGSMPTMHDTIINGREKMKETDEYRRVEEEEWASRQRQLQKQAEEAQKLRKRKKAEQLRILDMERRQKLRVEEVRQTQKKDEENMNLKEELRSEIRRELSKLEMSCIDMASLLRGLGIPVGSSSNPLSQEVRAAYKRALLRFHPDRASRGNIRQQVEAEEKFKLISRMKEKLMLTSCH